MVLKMVRNLKMLRNKKGISQQKLADTIGVTQQTINRYENNDTEPDIDTLIKFAEYFETSVDFLIGYTEPVSSSELNKDESNLINSYRQLSKRQKSSIRMILRCYTESD